MSISSDFRVFVFFYMLTLQALGIANKKTFSFLSFEFLKTKVNTAELDELVSFVIQSPS